MRNDFIFDVETYPNVFTFCAEHATAPIRVSFEISDFRNDSRLIIEFMDWLKETEGRMIGFNNLAFDYPVLHTLYRMGRSDARALYDKAQAIIQSQDDEGRWAHQVRPSDWVVPQMDLFKIHHFDNRARSTSLKALEFNMRSESIEDLPYRPGTVLTREQIEVLKDYNGHDVKETKRFYTYSQDMIAFREKLNTLYPSKDWTNHNDTKIGKDYFIMRLEEAGIDCYDYSPEGRTPRQTKRPQIALRDAILPWITFEEPEFNRVLQWFKDQVITETKGVFSDLTAQVHGFTFVFGLGGIHGSVESEIIESTETHSIVDLDVTSYYPNLAITNGFYPAHLGPEFCTIYKNLFDQRKQYPKKSAESAMLKLALNGVYGDSNNQFSPFYDPLFTMSITLNGQLLLCKLAEDLMAIPGLRMIQVNTDGLTVLIPNESRWLLDARVAGWQALTGLQLEEARYKRIFIRDVNNYIGQYEDGSLKRKGAYEWRAGWHQNASALVIPKVTEKVLVDNASIRDTLRTWPNLLDFMLRTKVPRSSFLSIEHAGREPQQLQNITRYYIAQGGGHLFKWMPPLAGKSEWRKIGVEAGWGVQVCNDLQDAGELPVDFDYYIREVEKLCLGLA